MSDAEPLGIPVDCFRYYVFQDPNWDYTTCRLNFDGAVADRAETARSRKLRRRPPGADRALVADRASPEPARHDSLLTIKDAKGVSMGLRPIRVDEKLAADEQHGNQFACRMIR